MPILCPKCETKIFRSEGEAAWRCVNAACPAQLKERLKHFASRKAMDIDHMGPAVISQLVASGRVKKFSDLLESLNASKLGNPFYHDASDGTLPEEVAVEWFKNNIIEKIKNT